MKYDLASARMMSRLEKMEAQQRQTTNAVWSSVDELAQRIDGLGTVETIELSRYQVPNQSTPVESETRPSDAPVILNRDTREISRRLGKSQYRLPLTTITAQDVHRQDYVNCHLAAKVNGYLTKIKFPASLTDTFRYANREEQYDLVGFPIGKVGRSESRVHEFETTSIKKQLLADREAEWIAQKKAALDRRRSA